MPSLVQLVTALAGRLSAEFNALRGQLAGVARAPMALTRASFDLLAGEGDLVPQRFYIISDQDAVFVALSSTAYLAASTAKFYPPLNLLENGLLEEASPAPQITTGEGSTASIVFDQAAARLVFTGGTLGGFCRAAFTIPGLEPGKYLLKFEGISAAGGCRPRFTLGGNMAELLFSTNLGEQTLVIDTPAGDDQFIISFFQNSTGRSFSIGKLRIYRQTVPLTLSNAVVSEDAPIGTVVGTLQGRIPGSTLTLVGDAEGRFIMDGLDIVTAQTLDYEQWPGHGIQVAELAPGCDLSPRTSNLGVGVGNVVNLQGLYSADQTIWPGKLAYTWSGQLMNLTPGSTLELVDDVGGRFVLDGSLLRNAVDITDENGVQFFPVVRETLAGVEDSPKDSAVQIVCTDQVPDD